VRAKKVRITATRNRIQDERSQIRMYQQQVQELKAQLQEIKAMQAMSTPSYSSIAAPVSVDDMHVRPATCMRRHCLMRALDTLLWPLLAPMTACAPARAVRAVRRATRGCRTR
jgi:predicted RNase H-like nuclease (RuvC/YqgF family)